MFIDLKLEMVLFGQPDRPSSFHGPNLNPNGGELIARGGAGGGKSWPRPCAKLLRALSPRLEERTNRKGAEERRGERGKSTASSLAFFLTRQSFPSNAKSRTHKKNLFPPFIFADSVYSFLGNATHRDHFKLLSSDGKSLLIGARNVVYNLSLADLSENVEQVKERLISSLLLRTIADRKLSLSPSLATRRN